MMNYMHDGQFSNPSHFSPAQTQNDVDGFDVADTSAPLQSWDNSGAALAVWRRDFPVEISRAIECLPLESLKSWTATSDVEGLEACIEGSLASCGIADANLKHFIARDMTLVSRVFSSNVTHRRLEYRFDIIKDDSCRRYHVDNYPERLAVTYRGPGTVAIPNGFADRALDEQKDYSGPEFEILPGWVSLFSGNRPDRKGLVHRSPRIVGTGHTRLFFCVNAARK